MERYSKAIANGWGEWTFSLRLKLVNLTLAIGQPYFYLASTQNHLPNSHIVFCLCQYLGFPHGTPNIFLQSYFVLQAMAQTLGNLGSSCEHLNVSSGELCRIFVTHTAVPQFQCLLQDPCGTVPSPLTFHVVVLHSVMASTAPCWRNWTTKCPCFKIGHEEFV